MSTTPQQQIFPQMQKPIKLISCYGVADENKGYSGTIQESRFQYFHFCQYNFNNSDTGRTWQPGRTWDIVISNEQLLTALKPFAKEGHFNDPI